MKTFKVGVRRGLFNHNLRLAIDSAHLTNESVGKAMGRSAGWVSMLVNFKVNPSEDEIVSLAKLLSVPTDHIFPEEYEEIYKKLSPIQRVGVVEIDCLRLDSPELLKLESGDDIEKSESNKLEVEKLLETSFLTEKEKQIIILRYGLDGNPPMNLEDVGREFGVTRERLRQIEAKALEKIRQRALAGNGVEYDWFRKKMVALRAVKTIGRDEIRLRDIEERYDHNN